MFHSLYAPPSIIRMIFLVLDTELHTKFQFCVPSVTFLVSPMSATQELLFLEGVGSPDTEFIVSLHVRTVVESHPEDRLVSLLDTMQR